MNARVSVVQTFGPGDEDTVEHVILKTCDVEGCDEPAAWYDKFCPRCREEVDALGLGQLPEFRPRDTQPPTKLHNILSAIRGLVKL